MRLIRRDGHWILAFVGVMCLAFAAGVMAQRQPLLTTPDGKDSPAVAHARAEANELSMAFRHAAKDALPAIVSIETVGRSAQVRGQQVDPEEFFGENSPFGDFFRNDPRLKDMFRNRAPRQMPRSHGMGSGFIIDSSGIVLTANHVVVDAEKVKVKLHDGREFIASDIKTDARTDVAVMRIKADGRLPTIKLGDSDAVEIGDWVLAIGSPFGLDATVTAGIVSAKGRGPRITEREDFIQTDAAINPGNSGGPLINLNGEVVAINTAISTRSGGYDGVGFAVPINLARWVADQLVERGSVTRAYLGVAIQPVDNDLSKDFNVPVGKGAVVTQVMPDSPAAAAKLEPGDLVLKLNGKDVHGPRDLQGIVERLKVGNSYPMQIVRDGKEMTVNVQMKEMPSEYALAGDRLLKEKPAPKTEDKPDSVNELGIEIQALTPELAKEFGYKNDVSGVLIASVKDGSPAESRGLREGMVIEKVGSQPVTSPAEFKQAMESLAKKPTVRLHVRSATSGPTFVVVPKEEK